MATANTLMNSNYVGTTTFGDLSAPRSTSGVNSSAAGSQSHSAAGDSEMQIDLHFDDENNPTVRTAALQDRRDASQAGALCSFRAPLMEETLHGYPLETLEVDCFPWTVTYRKGILSGVLDRGSSSASGSSHSSGSSDRTFSGSCLGRRIGGGEIVNYAAAQEAKRSSVSRQRRGSSKRGRSSRNSSKESSLADRRRSGNHRNGRGSASQRNGGGDTSNKSLQWIVEIHDYDSNPLGLPKDDHSFGLIPPMEVKMSRPLYLAVSKSVIVLGYYQDFCVYHTGTGSLIVPRTSLNGAARIAAVRCSETRVMVVTGDGNLWVWKLVGRDGMEVGSSGLENAVEAATLTTELPALPTFTADGGISSHANNNALSSKKEDASVPYCELKLEIREDISAMHGIDFIGFKKVRSRLGGLSVSSGASSASAGAISFPSEIEEVPYLICSPVPDSFGRASVGYAGGGAFRGINHGKVWSSSHEQGQQFQGGGILNLSGGIFNSPRNYNKSRKNAQLLKGGGGSGNAENDSAAEDSDSPNKKAESREWLADVAETTSSDNVLAAQQVQIGRPMEWVFNPGLCCFVLQKRGHYQEALFTFVVNGEKRNAIKALEKYIAACDTEGGLEEVTPARGESDSMLSSFDSQKTGGTAVSSGNNDAMSSGDVDMTDDATDPTSSDATRSSSSSPQVTVSSRNANGSSSRTAPLGVIGIDRLCAELRKYSDWKRVVEKAEREADAAGAEAKKENAAVKTAQATAGTKSNAPQAPQNTNPQQTAKTAFPVPGLLGGGTSGTPAVSGLTLGVYSGSGDDTSLNTLRAGVVSSDASPPHLIGPLHNIAACIERYWKMSPAEWIRKYVLPLLEFCPGLLEERNFVQAVLKAEQQAQQQAEQQRSSAASSTKPETGSRNHLAKAVGCGFLSSGEVVDLPTKPPRPAKMRSVALF